MRTFWGLLLCSLGLVFHSSAETFRNPRHIIIPSNPAQVGTADFNGDSRPDFYYTDPTGLNVILAKADGSYAAAQTTPLGATNIGCRAADFNGDGFADAVCFTPLYSATQSMAAVFSGNGDGSLRLTGTVTIPGSLVPGTNVLSYVAFSDINSDGHLDIVFQDSGSGVLFTWFGDGTGQFQTLVSYPCPSLTKVGEAQRSRTSTETATRISSLLTIPWSCSVSVTAHLPGCTAQDHG